MTTPTIDPEDEVVPETIPVTYEAYLDWWDKEAGRRGEWADGEVVVFLAALLKFIVSRKRLGVVIGSGYEVRTRDGAAREPDLKVVLNEHRDRITDRRLEGVPDLIVEVISRDSVTRDRRVKYAEYETAGVPEYWLFDPREGRGTVDVFTLDMHGRYEPTRLHDDGTVHSRIVPGFWFDPAWSTADEEPDVSELAMRMAGITPPPTPS